MKSCVLVLDEEMVTAERVREALQRESATPCPVRWCDTLHEVFDALAVTPVRLVIADVRLDGEDITAGLRRMRNLHPDAATLIFTAVPETAPFADLLEDGCLFLPKAAAPERLERALTAALYRPQPWWGASPG